MSDRYSFELESAKANTDESKAKALDAAATAGTAGLKAYNDARTQIIGDQQTAVQGALARSQNTGGGYTGTELAGQVAQRNLAHNTNMATGFDVRNKEMAASNSTYFDKLNASLPYLKNQTDTKIATTEMETKAAIAAAQAEAEAKAKEKQDEHDFQLERDRLREEKADARASKKDIPTLDQLLGQAWINQQEAQGIVSGAKGLNAQSVAPVSGSPFKKLPAATARYERQLAGQAKNKGLAAQAGVANQNARLVGPIATGNLTDLAYQLGVAAGVPASSLAGLFAPGKQSATNTATGKITPQQNTEVAKALAGKYDTKGVTQAVAATIMADPNYQEAVKKLTSQAGTGTREDWQAWIVKAFPGKPRTQAILLGEYLPLFPTAATAAAAAKRAAE